MKKLLLLCGLAVAACKDTITVDVDPEVHVTEGTTGSAEATPGCSREMVLSIPTLGQPHGGLEVTVQPDTLDCAPHAPSEPFTFLLTAEPGSAGKTFTVGFSVANAQGGAGTEAQFKVIVDAPPQGDAGTGADAGADAGTDAGSSGNADAGTAWVPVGGPLNRTPEDGGAFVSGIALERTPDGGLLAAWSELDSVWVARSAGSTWALLGGALNTNVAEAPALAIDSTGAPLVAWAEDDGTGGNRDVFVARYGGAGWSKLGGPLDVVPAMSAHSPSLRAGPQGPVAAFVEGTQRVVVRRWTGTAWENAGTTEGPVITAGTDSERPLLAVTPAGLAVSWLESGALVRVAELNGTAWANVVSSPFGAPITTQDYAFTASASDGLLVAAAPQNANAFQVRGWRAGAWADVGPPRMMAGSGPLILHVAFSHTPGADPLLAWTFRSNLMDVVVVERLAAGAWSRVGPPILPVNRQQNRGFALAVAVADGPHPAVLEVVNGNVGADLDHTVRAVDYR